MNEHSFSLYKKIEPWLDLKITEFQLLGYGQISQEDLWRYLTLFSWKRNTPTHYYQQIQHIMQLTPNDYLDFASVEVLISPIDSLEDMDINDLL
ncbi:post-transcriptional regulator [Carnobacterium funditum]|uniref:post-transcriptional regulator n=1 Tax=Carnobacterium funditum TaxID=2752 RepID=UPI0005553D40|nr:post-transcriptional regulator [Carnobacterium funditum]